MSVAARFEDVTVRFGGRPAVASVTFTIPAGLRTAMVGPNGGGKTTLARVLLGILTPEFGRVAFLDEQGRELPRPRIGYLPQRSTLSPQAPVTGLDLVGLSLSPGPGFGMSPAVEAEARRALGRAGLADDLATRPVGRLSGGQRQRVLLARAIAGTPALLLLDEPDTALDAEGMKTLRRLVAEEVAAGRTIVYVTHDSDAMGGADVVFRIDGRLTEETRA
ncbi:MAG: metal ABC transporter ATP-binding protein [Thermoanaerobaculia bacterium]